MKSRRKALKTLTQEKVVQISDYRNLKNGRSMRRLALVSSDKELAENLQKEFQDDDIEVHLFDSRFSLEQALKLGDWDGVLLDERNLRDDALSVCEKLKKTAKTDELIVMIISNNVSKDVIRQGYEKGCDEWITRLDDVNLLAKLLAHHLH